MKYLKQKISYILAAAILVMTVWSVGAGINNGDKRSSVGPLVAYASETSTEYVEVLDSTSAYIKNQITEPTVSSIGGEWAVMALARNGNEDALWYNTYYKNVISTLEDMETNKVITSKNYAALSSTKSTENSRLVIALTAIGADVTNIEGYNVLAPLGNMTFVTKQGINGAIFALIALDTNNYDVPVIPDDVTGTQTTREGLIEYILGKEIDGGGFALTGTSPDVDITAMVIQALAPYYNTKADVAVALDRAVTVLSNMQNDDGTFSSYGTANSESTAQVVTALSTLGINADSNELFVKEGYSALAGLLTFYNSSTGAFSHTPDSGDNQMATEQACYALAAYDRFINDRNSLYNMTDSTKLYNLNEVDTNKSPVDISKAAITLSTTSYIYDGKPKTPDIMVVLIINNNEKQEKVTLVKDSDYTVTYKDNKQPGTAVILVKGQGNYTGSIIGTFDITLPSPTITSIANTSSGIKLTWKKVSGATGYKIYRKTAGSSWKDYAVIKNAKTTSYIDKKVSNGKLYYYKIYAVTDKVTGKASASKKMYRLSRQTVTLSSKSLKLYMSWKKNKSATGYQIQYSKTSDMKKVVSKTIKNNKTLKLTLNKLKKGQTYYVRVRSYKKSGSTTYYGEWSKKVKIKVKK
jgi:hypothetical protein